MLFFAKNVIFLKNVIFHEKCYFSCGRGFRRRWLRPRSRSTAPAEVWKKLVSRDAMGQLGLKAELTLADLMTYIPNRAALTGAFARAFWAFAVLDEVEALLDVSREARAFIVAHKGAGNQEPGNVMVLMQPWALTVSA